jgi:hypothetical protein
LIKEFWLAHRINHGRYEQVNAEIKKDFKIIAVKDIKKGGEILLDYNRNVLCLNCFEENCFFDNIFMDCYCGDARKWGEATSIVSFVPDIFASNAIIKVKLVV